MDRLRPVDLSAARVVADDHVDRGVVAYVVQSLAAMGIQTETGERAAADTVSAKVKRRIAAQHMFVSRR